MILVIDRSIKRHGQLTAYVEIITEPDKVFHGDEYDQMTVCTKANFNEARDYAVGIVKAYNIIEADVRYLIDGEGHSLSL